MRVARSRRLVAEGYALATVARVLKVSRQALYRTPTPRTVPQRRPPVDPIEQAIVELAQANQTDGYRMVCAFVRRVAAYRASRIDIADATRTNIGTSLNMIVGALDAAPSLDSFTPQQIAEAVARLHASGYKRETIRKAVTQLACAFDFAEIEPNPVRDKLRVRLPRGDVREPEPPSADHVESVYRLLPSKHRLALLWLDWSGARVSSIHTTTIGDYDESRRRVRLRAAASKTKRALWVDLPDVLADAIERTLAPREDRDLEARLFGSSGADAIRTSIAKACRGAGVPPWSPHDLRHRRISLLHRQGRTWAEIGALVGQRSPKVTSDTYTHVLVDGRELDYAELLARP
jgi:integrase